jgi:hypothetical protein
VSGICKTSEDSSAYLPSAIACARIECNADPWELDLFLAPLQLYCEAIDCAIPDHVMTDAYAAASGDGSSPTTATRYTHSPAKTDTPKPTNTNGSNDDDPTSIITTTYTKTTTDSDGNTLQVIVPIVMGPTAISTGSTITSTVGGSMGSTEMSSSTAASPSSTAQASGPAPGTSSTSASGSEETRSPANGNGSPFENMQAGAGRWTVSVPMFGLGALAVVLVRL